MPAPSLKDKLIDKLREIDDPALLAEVSNLFELQEPETVYKVSPAQKKSIEEAKQQAREGRVVDNEQADKETDEWLSE
ncbi:hypothetical protein [Terrimonas pollutisoli]|uniref:hypothetical protein n=1 Tax=Terrimonas pollutisoli TaxID=3034147 RepID=UPI0023EC104E|nr:hypothetical protein [Terrimonas sp. H1YJ31]